jgi:hypothetical protein
MAYEAMFAALVHGRSDLVTVRSLFPSLGAEVCEFSLSVVYDCKLARLCKWKSELLLY